jgi:hypothetical protein
MDTLTSHRQIRRLHLRKITQRMEQPAVKSKRSMARTKIKEVGYRTCEKPCPRVPDSDRIDSCQRSTSIEAANS